MAPPEVSDRDIPAEQVVSRLTGQKESWFTKDESIPYFWKQLMEEQVSDEVEESINPPLYTRDRSEFIYGYMSGQTSGHLDILWKEKWLTVYSMKSPQIRIMSNRESETDVICYKEGSSTKEEQSSDIPDAKEINVNSSDSPSQNDPVHNTVPEANNVGDDSSCEADLQQVAHEPLCAIQERGTGSIKIVPRRKDDPVLSLKTFPKVKLRSEIKEGMMPDKPQRVQQVRSKLQAVSKSEAGNVRLVINRPLNETRATSVVICGNHPKDSFESIWKVGVTYFSVEKFMKELSQIMLNSKLKFGGYKEEPPPYSTQDSSQGSSGKKSPVNEAASKELDLKCEENLIKNERTVHIDQRSNRDLEKIEKGAPAHKINALSSGPGKHQIAQRNPPKFINSEPSDSTQSSSSSRSKSGGNGSNFSSTKREKMGGASNQGGGALSGEGGTGKENSDGQPPADRRKKNQNVSPQSDVDKKEGSRTQLEAIHNKAAIQSRPKVCPKPPPWPTSLGTEVQSQNPPADNIYNGADEQPRSKPCPITLATLGGKGISQNPPIDTHNQAANQPRSSFNVKPPPDTQAAHGTELSSGLSSQNEWNGPTKRHSASANNLEVTVRDYVATPGYSGFPLSPAGQLNTNKPQTNNELPLTEAASNKIDEDLIGNEAVQSPSSECPMVDLPCLTLPTIDQHVFNNHNTLSFLERESTVEFCPLSFISLAGDDLIPSQCNECGQVLGVQVKCLFHLSRSSSQVVSTGDDSQDVYQHPVEEAGNVEPDRTEMVVSSLARPADHMYHPPPQGGDVLMHATLSSRVVSPLYDIWYFTALVDVFDNNRSY